MPFSWLYFFASSLRNLYVKPFVLNNKFVICVGNIVVGGAGKTPVAIALCNELKNLGHSVCFLSRGYRRKTNGFVIVNENLSAAETGDEPQLLKKNATVYLYSNAKDIQKNIDCIKEDIIIMDDGLQNNSIVKDYSILVVGENYFGNGMIFPAGPLREKPDSIKTKVDYTVYMGGSKLEVFHNEACVLKNFYTELPLQSVIAFSGIGNNAKFLESLNVYGFNVLNFFEFPDHYYYSDRDIENIINCAEKLNVRIITTEKDFVKINPKYHSKISLLKMSIVLESAIVNDIENNIPRKTT